MTLDMGGLQSQLTGRYPAIGVNNPKRYPKRPDSQPKKTTQQTTDDMKETLRSLMRRQHGSNP